MVFDYGIGNAMRASFVSFTSLSVLLMMGACGPSEDSSPPPEGPEEHAQGIVPAAADEQPPPPSGFAGAVEQKVEYSPYFYVWSWQSSQYMLHSLVDAHDRLGLDSATLAFVVSKDAACVATDDIQSHLGDVRMFMALGGHVRASFGGLTNTYLENVCPDSASLADAIAAFVDTTGITDLDFDIEHAEAHTDAINALRNQALRSVQASRGVKISFSLPSSPRGATGTPGGIRAEALRALTSAVDAGVSISRVNLMTMDFGTAFSADGTGRTMGELAESAVDDATTQLADVFPWMSAVERGQMLGATPMIGQNDRDGEVFDLSDAAVLVGLAKQRRLGFLSFWALQRDQPCDVAAVSACSNAQTTPYAFHELFKRGL